MKGQSKNLDQNKNVKDTEDVVKIKPKFSIRGMQSGADSLLYFYPDS